MKKVLVTGGNRISRRMDNPRTARKGICGTDNRSFYEKIRKCNFNA